MVSKLLGQTFFETLRYPLHSKARQVIRDFCPGLGSLIRTQIRIPQKVALENHFYEILVRRPGNPRPPFSRIIKFGGPWDVNDVLDYYFFEPGQIRDPTIFVDVSSLPIACRFAPVISDRAGHERIIATFIAKMGLWAVASVRIGIPRLFFGNQIRRKSKPITFRLRGPHKIPHIGQNANGGKLPAVI
jgi:hypothetical protein